MSVPNESPPISNTPEGANRMTDQTSIDPELLKALTEEEKGRLTQADLPSDGDGVLAGVDPPTTEEVLAHGIG